MNTVIHYYYSTQKKHKKKPLRIEFDIQSGDLSCTMDVHGRFKNQRDASEVARNIACRLGTYSEEWGRIVVESEPPQITTLD